MTVQSDDWTCAAFEAALPDYLEGELESAANVTARAHLAGCSRCQSLVQDLERIRAQAAGLPDLQPGRDLWSEIDMHIETPAIRRGASRGARTSRGRGAAWSEWFGTPWSGGGGGRSALRAAALILATSGVTVLAIRWRGGSATVPAAAPGVTAMVERPAASRAPSGSGTVSGVTPGGGAASTVAPRVIPTAESATAARNVANRTVVPAATSAFIYEQQITALHEILEQRRVRLDPKTVAIVEKNLRVIDAAIAESRAALAKDPANAFLAQQLDQSLDTKVELLRTVAMLPTRT